MKAGMGGDDDDITSLMEELDDESDFKRKDSYMDRYKGKI